MNVGYSKIKHEVITKGKRDILSHFSSQNMESKGIQGIDKQLGNRARQTEGNAGEGGRGASIINQQTPLFERGLCARRGDILVGERRSSRTL